MIEERDGGVADGTVHSDAAFDAEEMVATTLPPAASFDVARFARRFLDSARVIITALALAFVFRAFFVEPFIIPTGSMAPALLGDHWTVVCTACGAQFDTVQNVSANPDNNVSIRCGNCREFFVPPTAGLIRKPGDRILVHKWIDSVVPPERWGVYVFRDPASPLQHYIKRIVGLPGDEIEIIDGDIYIDGTIMRKPAWVQAALWQPCYVQSHVQVSSRRSFSTWMATGQQPEWSGLDERVLRFAPGENASAGVRFFPDAGEYAFDYSHYNGTSDGNRTVDLRLRTIIDWQQVNAACAIRITLATCEIRCELAANGRGAIDVVAFADDANVLHEEFELTPDHTGVLEIAHVDQAVVLSWDDIAVFESPADFGVTTSEARRGTAGQAPEVEITGSGGAFALRALRIDRDVYYTASRMAVRAVRGEPFQLEAGEYFALGDNSADSKDSREWLEYGPHLPNGYRLGTVPRTKIVGRAAFVYLPGLQRSAADAFRMVDVGRMRFIR